MTKIVLCLSKLNEREREVLLYTLTKMTTARRKRKRPRRFPADIA
jgi:hypothetical protein